MVRRASDRSTSALFSVSLCVFAFDFAPTNQPLGLTVKAHTCQRDVLMSVLTCQRDVLMPVLTCQRDVLIPVLTCKPAIAESHQFARDYVLVCVENDAFCLCRKCKQFSELNEACLFARFECKLTCLFVCVFVWTCVESFALDRAQSTRFRVWLCLCMWLCVHLCARVRVRLSHFEKIGLGRRVCQHDHRQL
jgi:hypothetical protein